MIHLLSQHPLRQCHIQQCITETFPYSHRRFSCYTASKAFWRMCFVQIHDCRVKRLDLMPNLSCMASNLPEVFFKTLHSYTTHMNDKTEHTSTLKQISLYPAVSKSFTSSGKLTCLRAFKSFGTSTRFEVGSTHTIISCRPANCVLYYCSHSPWQTYHFRIHAVWTTLHMTYTVL